MCKTIDTMKPTLFAIVETHLKDKIPERLMPKSYSWIGKNRRGKKPKGGVGIFVEKRSDSY